MDLSQQRPRRKRPALPRKPRSGTSSSLCFFSVRERSRFCPPPSRPRDHRSRHAGALPLVRSLARPPLEAARFRLRCAQAALHPADARSTRTTPARNPRPDRALRAVEPAFDAPLCQLRARRDLRIERDPSPVPNARAAAQNWNPKSVPDRFRCGQLRRHGRANGRRSVGIGHSGTESDKPRSQAGGIPRVLLLQPSHWLAPAKPSNRARTPAPSQQSARAHRRRSDHARRSARSTAATSEWRCASPPECAPDTTDRDRRTPAACAP